MEEAFINGKISPVNLLSYRDHKESIKALDSQSPRMSEHGTQDGATNITFGDIQNGK